MDWIATHVYPLITHSLGILVLSWLGARLHTVAVVRDKIIRKHGPLTFRWIKYLRLRGIQITSSLMTSVAAYGGTVTLVGDVVPPELVALLAGSSADKLISFASNALLQGKAEPETSVACDPDDPTDATMIANAMMETTQLFRPRTRQRKDD